MKLYIVVILSFFICSCNKNIIDFKYKGEKNYHNFYVVDTIIIENPIIVRYLGGRFVFSKHLLDTLKLNNDFVKRPDVFLLGDNLYYDLPNEEYDKFKYPDDGGCEIKHVKQSNWEGYEFENRSIRFILGLINANYYNVKHNSYNYYSIKSSSPKSSFYKIVYPLCSD